MGVKALLIYPEMPTTFWGMRYALSFLGRKATLLAQCVVTETRMSGDDVVFLRASLDVVAAQRILYHRFDYLGRTSMEAQSS